MFTALCQFMTQNSKNTNGQSPCSTFFTSEKLTLNGSVNDTVIIYSKIQDRLSRVP